MILFDFLYVFYCQCNLFTINIVCHSLCFSMTNNYLCGWAGGVVGLPILLCPDPLLSTIFGSLVRFNAFSAARLLTLIFLGTTTNMAQNIQLKNKNVPLQSFNLRHITIGTYAYKRDVPSLLFALFSHKLSAKKMLRLRKVHCNRCGAGTSQKQPSVVHFKS